MNGVRAGTSLFTGFPGFIGERLLPRLLELQTGLSSVCLVQSRFRDVAMRSVGAIEARHPHTVGRIRLVEGDITSPGLGLSAHEAQALRGQLSSAHHLAAVYDLAVGRDLGMRVNVDGTRNVLRFLADCPSFTRLHYVSTAYVSGTATGVFKEDDLDVGQRFKNFYEETKFLAEREAVQSGLPVTTYRPSIVVGDSRNGETAKFDGPYFTLGAMDRMPSPGIFMRVGSGRQPANLVPIDFIVEALAQLSSGAPDPDGHTYHLTDPAPLSVFEVAQLFARALGKRFAYVPVPVAAARAAFRAPGIQRFLGIPVQSLDYYDHPCQYDTTRATRDLALRGVRCPDFGSYVETLVEFYQRRKGTIRREAMV